jgi:hypothetical protein
MPKIRVSNKDRVEDDVIDEILQDPEKFEELLKEREQPPRPKPVKKFASLLPSRQSMRLQTSERVDIADGPVDSRSKVSPPIARLVSENPLREPWIFVEGEGPPRTTASSLKRNGSSGGTKIRNHSTTVMNFSRRAQQCIRKGHLLQAAKLQEKRHPDKSQSTGTRWKGRNGMKRSANSS